MLFRKSLQNLQENTFAGESLQIWSNFKCILTWPTFQTTVSRDLQDYKKIQNEMENDINKIQKHSVGKALMSIFFRQIIDF